MWSMTAHHFFVMIPALVFLLFLNEPSLAASETTVKLKSPTLERTYTVTEGGHLSTSKIYNAHLPVAEYKAYPGNDHEFSLVLSDGTVLDSTDFTVESYEAKGDEDGSSEGYKALEVHLVGNGDLKAQAKNISITFHAGVVDGADALRKHLEISGPKGTIITSYRLESLSLPSNEENGEYVCRGSTKFDVGGEDDTGDLPHGLGQPLYYHSLFFGLEHPGAENIATKDGLWCWAAINDTITLSATPSFTKSAVVGSSLPDDERAAFWRYIQSTRAYQARVVALINNWYQFGWAEQVKGGPPQNQSMVVNELGEFTKKFDEFGITLDHYCLDDNWDGEWVEETGLWGRFAPSRFPGGLGALEDAFEKGKIGLWIGPHGGYNQPLPKRVAFAESQGWGIDGNGHLWVGDPHYSHHLASSMADWVRKGIGYFKLDGVFFHCSDKCHGDDMVTKEMDKWISVLQTARKANPEVVLAFTSGSTPSAWWLQYADFIWREGVDDDVTKGDTNLHDRFSSYIDECLHALKDTQVPVSSYVTFSMIQNEAVSYSSKDENPDEFERNMWLMVGRGQLHHDLYIGPQDLADYQWELLAEVLSYVRDRKDVLVSSRMVMGSPKNNEVYGFASGDIDSRFWIVCVRNPSNETAQTVSFKPSDYFNTLESSWSLVRPIFAKQSLPSTPINVNESLSLDLKPYEVLLFELLPSQQGLPLNSIHISEN